MTAEERARRFFEARCRRREPAEATAIGHTSDDEIVGSALRINDREDEEVAAARAFQAALFDAGLASLGGSPDFGGAGLDDDQISAVRRVAREYVLPDLNCLYVGQHIVAPAVDVFGTDEQRKEWLPAFSRGDVIGCQLFSEPDAGSDLASLATRAVRDGDGWRVSGQKVWSSGAHFSDVGELLARTDPDAALRHRGLTMFLVDMDTPGVSVRPLRQMNGSAHFSEVFFDDVLVPDDRRLGEVGQGWSVAHTSLTSERDGFGEDDSQLFDALYPRLVALVRDLGQAGDALRRNQLADVHTREVISGLLAGRLMQAPPSIAAVASSMIKLYATDRDWRIAEVAAEALGPAAIADGGEAGRYAWSRVLLGVPAPRIAGGTDQIQRNIVAERGLGLPRDPR